MRFATIACVPVACAALAVAGCGGDGSGSTTPTTSAPTTQTSAPSTSTATAPTQTVQTNPTRTGNAGATITQVQAKTAARRAAGREAARGGIHVPPGQWDAKCTAVGGRDRSSTWRCQVASLGGQCNGTLTAYAAAPGVAATRQVNVACGE
jgi:hypothetical protein